MRNFLRQLFFGFVLPWLLIPTPTAASKPPEVRRALPVVSDGQTISEADVRATIAHMQALAKDQEEQLAARDRINTDLVEQLNSARAHNDAASKTATDLAIQVRAQDEEVASLKWKRFKDRILGWPVATLIGVLLGVGFSLFSSFGAKVAGLAARVGLKASTGI